MIITLIKELGIPWLSCRALYSAKLKMLNALPFTEALFEHNVTVKRTDILPDNTERTESFIKNLPNDAKEELIRSADLAVGGTVKGFSAVLMDYGMPVNWQLNPLTKKSCSIEDKWYKIPDFEEKRGDIKAIWEISRFSHFVTLARAYLATDDRKYYLAFSSQLADWLEKNPYSYGANYKCGQECALRMLNALLAYNVFRSKGVADGQDEKNIAELIKRCYQKILSNFFYAHKCIKNNHTISELVGMTVGAWCCCDNKRLKKAYRLLDKVIADQFFADGGYTQYSFNYLRLVLQDLEYLFCISERTGISLSEDSVERIKRTVHLFYQCQDQSGDVPNYGANDGALIFPVSSSPYRDFRPVISSLYATLFGKRIYESGIYDEELLWFGKAPDSLPFEPLQRSSIKSLQAGLFTLRGNGFWLMTVLNDYKKRPSHMDQLHIDLWINGVNALCDLGTYSYADSSGKALALTEAHNTVKLANVEQMNKKGNFLVYNRTKRLGFEICEDEFYGSIRSKNGYTHERRIKQHNGGFDIFDKISSKKNDEFSLILNTPCKITVNENKILLFDNDRHILTISGTLEFEIKEGIRSLYYLCKEPISQIRFKGTLQNGNAESVIKLEIN
ncbi:MAG: alginate lyase family protein [Clostridia bacterium]|nr:alginate lyase family protein [Clostridia bacterium]